MIAIGASAGGVEALLEVAAGLPADLAAAVFVVLHTPPHGAGRLPRLLGRRGPLPAAHAVHGEPIRHGRIYVAPPDFHLQLRAGHIELSHGPRENHMRPAIDPLFRGAARAYGPRVVAVVLSGTLGDGSLGMMIVKARGGVCIVQDPEEALFGDMPRAALRLTAVDRVLPARGIARAVVDLSRRTVEERRVAAPREGQDPAASGMAVIRAGIGVQEQDGGRTLYTDSRAVGPRAGARWRARRLA